MITSTVVVCDRMDKVLFDTGSTYSYVFVSFAFDLKRMCDILDAPVCLSNPVGKSFIVTHVYHA